MAPVFSSPPTKELTMKPNPYPPTLVALFRPPSPAAEIVLNVDRVAKRMFPPIPASLFPPIPAMPAIINAIANLKVI
jgi:hypothetical protein